MLGGRCRRQAIIGVPEHVREMATGKVLQKNYIVSTCKT